MVPVLLIPSGASAAYCDQSANGCSSAAAAGAQCDTGAGSGAFGAFGDKGDVAHDFRGGANGQQTGRNNSALCGKSTGQPVERPQLEIQETARQGRRAFSFYGAPKLESATARL
jgi:predicted chitinase